MAGSAPHFWFQFCQINEYVRLSAQVVGDHGWLSGECGDDRYADTAALQRFHQRTKIAIAREQHDLIDVLGELHRIYGEVDIHAALHLAAAGDGVDEFLRELGDDGVSVIVEPIDQGADRRILLILDEGRVVEGPQQRTSALEFAEQTPVVDVEAERLGGGMEIGAIDKECDLLNRRHSA
ncbi:hypothetical protein ACVJMY_003108 [Bradyrhizobium diazoefficiens]